MSRPDSPILRPSSRFKKLSYEHICTILDLLQEVDTDSKPENRLDEKEQEARSALIEIQIAMEQKRAQEDYEAKARKKAQKR